MCMNILNAFSHLLGEKLHRKHYSAFKHDKYRGKQNRQWTVSQRKSRNALRCRRYILGHVCKMFLRQSLILADGSGYSIFQYSARKVPGYFFSWEKSVSPFLSLSIIYLSICPPIYLSNNHLCSALWILTLLHLDHPIRRAFLWFHFIH